MAPVGDVKSSGVGREGVQDVNMNYLRPKTVLANFEAETPESPFIMC